MEIQGRYDKKFESIVDCYKKQFELGLDIGSSLALTYEGEIVIDIWAGTGTKLSRYLGKKILSSMFFLVQKMQHRFSSLCSC